MVAEELKKSLDEFFSLEVRPAIQVAFWTVVGFLVTYLW